MPLVNKQIQRENHCWIMYIYSKEKERQTLNFWTIRRKQVIWDFRIPYIIWKVTSSQRETTAEEDVKILETFFSIPFVPYLIVKVYLLFTHGKTCLNIYLFFRRLTIQSLPFLTEDKSPNIHMKKKIEKVNQRKRSENANVSDLILWTEFPNPIPRGIMQRPNQIKRASILSYHCINVKNKIFRFLTSPISKIGLVCWNQKDPSV